LVSSFLEIFFLLKLFHCISLSLFHLFPLLFYSFIVFTFILFMFVSCFYFFYFYFVYLNFFLFLCMYYYNFLIFFFKNILVFLICFIMKIIFFKNYIFVWLDAGPPVFSKDFFNRNGTSHSPPQRLPWPPCPALPCPGCHQLHRERVVIGRIFQALPTQTDTTVALIYKIVYVMCLHN
jgi:hypothetical protein